MVECPNDDYLVYDHSGTDVFMPPECFSGKGVKPKGMDIWGLGVSIYACLVGKLPFDGENRNQIVEKIKNEGFDIPVDCSPELHEVLHKLLTKDPEQRPNITKVLEMARFN